VVPCGKSGKGFIVFFVSKTPNPNNDHKIITKSFVNITVTRRLEVKIAQFSKKLHKESPSQKMKKYLQPSTICKFKISTSNHF
jgi:hypothetical protein